MNIWELWCPLAVECQGGVVCLAETDYTMAPQAGDVYLHPHILALGLKFLLTNFVRDLLRHFLFAASQLAAGVGASSWASKPFVILSPPIPTGSKISPPSM